MNSITLDNHSPRTAIHSPSDADGRENGQNPQTTHFKDSYGFLRERHGLCQVRWKLPGCL